MEKQTNKTFSVYEIIADYYYELKDIAIRETIKFGTANKDLDEDIFHSGLLRMAETLGSISLTIPQAKGYWCNLYKNALLRQCMYARVKYRNNGEFDASLFKTKESDLDSKIDLEGILSDIKCHFTEEDYNIYYDFICGFTLRELNEKYGISNSDYRVRRIKNYIKENYNDVKIKRGKRRH